MNLKYIYHSSFYLELEECAFIFDYYKGDIPDIDKDKKLYVLSSHRHNDHYNEKIFDIFADYNVSYILSDDIKVKDKYKLENIIYLSSEDECQIDDIKVRTLESTDEGVAFIVTAEEKTIYHSGDLNWWTWKGFESEEEFNSMTERFKREIAKIKGLEIDLAMAVLDYRQKERYDWGLVYLLENTNIKYIAPMHCWEKYEFIDKFREEHKDLLKDTVLINTDKISKEGYLI
ncbi:MBL fold metallo-hydrolase [Peptostreptococcus russellii]|uniref:MBL fold metallo-hydrolase n=1 Tax=Peptostreptococcus russellii TaxID=215200 RepID=UPI0029427266|nr:MBL fold metallo-hydrolase [Peptostreptococcus russellii]